MIVDASALVSILREESDGDELLKALESADCLLISAANFLEAAMVIDGGRDPVASRRFEEFVSAAPITIEPVTENQARIARAAFRDFGKGSGHRARLNFGDCFAYALAIEKSQPLLCKGNDFCHTDVGIAPV